MRKLNAVRAAVLAALGPILGRAGTLWQGTTGNWFDSANWSAGVPTSALEGDIDNGGMAQIAAPGAVVGGLRLGASAFGQGHLTLSTGGSLSAIVEYVGYSGVGTFDQLDGTNTATSLLLGFANASSGSYQLQGGVLSVGTLQLNEVNSFFTQTGGSLSVKTFTESAGSATLQALTIGSQQEVGKYQLSNGYLTSPMITVMNGGTLVLGNGMLTCNTLNIAGGSVTFGTAVLDSGAAVMVVNTPAGKPQPTINISGGTVTATNVYLGTAAGSFSYKEPSSGVPIGATNLYVGYAAQSNGTYSQSSGSMSLSQLTVGESGNGNFFQNGTASSLIDAGLVLGDSKGASGTYTLGAGSLNAGTIIVGNAGTGAFVQNGGTNIVTTLTIGHGSYALNGGSLSANTINFGSNSAFTSTGGTLSFGTFIQAGGSVTAGVAASPFSDPLILGSGGPGGKYLLNGGTLSTSTLNINQGGSFTVLSAGTLSCSTINLNGGQLSLPSAVLDSGSPAFNIPVPGGAAQPALNLNSGTLFVSSMILGSSAGTYNYTQSLPYSLSGGLTVASASNSTATYNFGNGQVYSTGAIALGRTDGTATGYFNQTGGSVTASLQVNTGGYNLSGGSVTAFVVTVGNGSFTQSGGSIGLGSNNNIEVGTGTSPGTYTLSGGSIYGYGTIYVGYNGPGVFYQTGGSLSSTNILVGEYGGTAKGDFYLSGGSFGGGLGVYAGGTFNVQNVTAHPYEVGNYSKITLSGASGTSQAGKLNCSGEYYQTGELDIGIGGSNAGSDFAQLIIGTAASLGGTIVVSLTNNFIPGPGESFEIIEWESFTGTFSHATLPAGMSLTYASNGVFVTMTPEPSSLLAGLCGLAGLLPRRRRRGTVA